MITTIKITESAKSDARIYANKIIEKGITDPNHPSGVNGGTIFDRYYYGYLGEWGFNEFLSINKIKDSIKWDREADGLADKGDFFFGGKIIDVKNASKECYTRLMIPLVQFERCKKDYYVGTKMLSKYFKDDYIEIMGYALSEDIRQAQVGDFGIGSTKWIYHSNLKDIKGLVNQDILKKWEDKE